MCQTVPQFLDQHIYETAQFYIPKARLDWTGIVGIPHFLGD